MADDLVRIFDTTLRDGEQAARINLNTSEKLTIARQLERLGVDVIEAGFPAASPGDFEAVAAVARGVSRPSVAALARTREADISAAGRALEGAARPRIHTFIATSPIHMEYKLRMTPKQVLRETELAVKLARSITPDVEFSAEDASRSEIDFLVEVFTAAAENGASTINIPDTVGYAEPNEFEQFVRTIIERVGKPNIIWSVHCHNDLGLAVANSLAAVRGGARQIECTINGLGERAGNASLEEIVMALRTRHDRYDADSRIESQMLWSTSKLVQNLTGVRVQPNKAVVGTNAFSHEAGIHQHGMMANAATYEIMTPQSVGASGTDLHLGKHSGRHAFVQRAEDLGYELTDEQKEKTFALFKDLCDKKKDVSDGDIEALILDTISNVAPDRLYELSGYTVAVSSGSKPVASITIKHGDETQTASGFGNGPVDAAYQAIKQLIDFDPTLTEFRIRATSEHEEALGEASLILGSDEMRAAGRATSTDIIEATIRAYIEAVNRLERLKKIAESKTEHRP